MKEHKQKLRMNLKLNFIYLIMEEEVDNSNLVRELIRKS